jgi:hypothetical protein
VTALRDAADAAVGTDRHTAAVISQISPLDGHPYARALAAATRDKNRALGETLIEQHGLPRVDTADPATMDRIYGIVDKRPRYLHPLSETFTWRDLAHVKLTAYSTCDVGLSLDCEKRSATEVFAVKRGRAGVRLSGVPPVRGVVRHRRTPGAARPGPLLRRPGGRRPLEG